MPPLEMLFGFKIAFFVSSARAEEPPPESSPVDPPPSGAEEPPPEEGSPEEPPTEESSETQPSVTLNEPPDLSGQLEPIGQIALPASLSVDDFTGAAHVSYPLVLPPGRISPKLSLNYSSLRGNGPLGVGWELPISFIQRRGARKGVPKYDDTGAKTDVFQLKLEGDVPQDLVAYPGGGTGHYRLKIEGPYLRIMYTSQGNYWEVTDKLGMKMRFGYSASSRIGPNPSQNSGSSGTFRWYLDKIEDPKGNYIEFIYQKPEDNPEQIYPQEIRYNGNSKAGLTHNHLVTFTLENRDDVIYDYRGGFASVTKKRIALIETKTNQNLVRRYQLQYTMPNKKSVLSSVTVFGSDGSTSLPPTDFSYQAHVAGFENEETSWSGPYTGVTPQLIRNHEPLEGKGIQADLIDMNGDGLLDRVVYDETEPYTTWRVYLNNGEGFNSGVDWPHPTPPTGITLIRQNDVVEQQIYGVVADVIDMNGDGLPDRVLPSNGSCSPPTICWDVFLNTGNGFSSTAIRWSNPSAYSRIRENSIGLIAEGVVADVIDMNGDGLPDRVVGEPGTTWRVYFNTGSNFSSGTTWSNSSGYIRENYISGDTVLGISADVIDMNGDGLPDRVAQPTGSCSPYTWCWYVYLNTGNGFSSTPIRWRIPLDEMGTLVRAYGPYGFMMDMIDVNGDGLPDRVKSNEFPDFTPWRVQLNTGTGFNNAVNWPHPVLDPNLPPGMRYVRGNYMQNGRNAEVLDLDGDGLPDRVLAGDCAVPFTCSFRLYPNRGPVADLLWKVETNVGREIEISYRPSTDFSNTFLPFVVQVVGKVTRRDGRGNSYDTTYTYSGGYYDAATVEFRGFRTVTKCEPDCEDPELRTETVFIQADYYKKGKIERQTQTSREGHTKEVVNVWSNISTPGGGYFPSLTSSTTTVTDVGEGGPYAYAYKTTYAYDSALNVSQDDKWHKEDQFIKDKSTVTVYSNCTSQWILSKPTDMKITDGSGTIFSRKWMDYECTTGNLVTEELCKSNNPNTDCTFRNTSRDVVTNYTYYAFGSCTTCGPLWKTIGPREGQLTTLSYETTWTHVLTKSQCVDLPDCTTQHVTTTEYDLGLGKVKRLVPPHLQGTPYWFQTKYDPFGRKILELLKDNADPEAPPLVDRGSTSYAYLDFDDPENQRIVKTEHIVIEGMPARTLERVTTTYFDGMTRTYKEAKSGPASCGTIFKNTDYDSVADRVWKQSNPYCQNEPRYDRIFSYDGFSRVTQIEKPEKPPTRPTLGYREITTYQGPRRIVSKEFDADQWRSTANTYDVYQRLIEVEEAYGTPMATRTQYTYDPLDNLRQVVAAKTGTGCPPDQSGYPVCVEKNTTTMTYDSLSKKISMNDPDMGYWIYTYDKSGNLTSQIDAKSQTLLFEYDGLNRMKRKTYQNEVPSHWAVFSYDETPNCVGKLTRVCDYVGGVCEQEDSVLECDLRQNPTRTYKRVGNVGNRFVTLQKSYDSAGRPVSLSYLSGGEVPSEKTFSYEYDVAGNIIYIKDSGTGWNLVEYSEYTALGQPGRVVYPNPGGNRVETIYAYYPETRRLESVITRRDGLPNDYQNLYYEYDGVGNILIQVDAVNNVLHTYGYDALNRLTWAKGNDGSVYDEAYSYDRIGNIKSKTNVGTEYVYTYNNKPHAVRQILDGQTVRFNFSYDNNGNMVVKEDVQAGVTWTMEYNYDNMPTLIEKGGTSVLFTYDGNGQRVKKESSFGTVLYFGESFETREGVKTIHLFAGPRRVASIEYGGQTKFYHTDHLGSTRVVTDATGEPVEMIQYYPFGSYLGGDPIIPYTFTGQEYDDELGFYNYKARLYDPVIGRFITPDSIVPRPDDPQSLNRYTYARNNPLYYNDPTGHEEGGPDQGEGSSTGISPGTSPEPGPLGPGISTGWSSSNSFANETSFWGEVTPSVTTTPLSTENKLGKNPFVIAQAKSPTKKGGYEKGDICFERMRQQIESRGKPGPYDCAICCAELIGAPSYAEIVVCETVCATAFQVYGKDGETR